MLTRCKICDTLYEHTSVRYPHLEPTEEYCPECADEIELAIDDYEIMGDVDLIGKAYDTRQFTPLEWMEVFKEAAIDVRTPPKWVTDAFIRVAGLYHIRPSSKDFNIVEGWSRYCDGE